MQTASKDLASTLPNNKPIKVLIEKAVIPLTITYECAQELMLYHQFFDVLENEQCIVLTPITKKSRKVDKELKDLILDLITANNGPTEHHDIMRNLWRHGTRTEFSNAIASLIIENKIVSYTPARILNAKPGRKSLLYILKELADMNGNEQKPSEPIKIENDGLCICGHVDYTHGKERTKCIVSTCDCKQYVEAPIVEKAS